MMEIICTPGAFNKWHAQLIVDGVVECTASSPYPGCAIRDVVNEFCRKYNSIPTAAIRLQITDWE